MDNPLQGTTSWYITTNSSERPGTWVTKQTGNIGNTLIVPGATSEARSSCLNDPRTRSVDVDSGRTESGADAEPYLRSRAVTTGDEAFSFAAHRAAGQP